MEGWFVVTVLMLMITSIPFLPVEAQQKPFTQDQAEGMVRDGLGNETEAKAIEHWGIIATPDDDFLERLKGAGKNDALLMASWEVCVV